MNFLKLGLLYCIIALLLFTKITASWDLLTNRPTSCGRQKIGFGMIILGSKVTRGLHPWVAVLIDTNGNVFCGGTLISSKFVLTAAHCVEGKDNSHSHKSRDILVILGAYDLKKCHEVGKVTSSVIKIHLHPDWHPYIASYDGDIAILELEDDVVFNRYIQPICIAEPQSIAASKTLGVVVGHGHSEFADTENIARLVNTPIHNYSDCIKSNEHQPMLSHRTFCGGAADGSGVCTGDSGSGLIVSHDNTFYIRGIVSASLYGTLYGCNVNQYSVFTDVTKFYSWIMTGDDNSLMMRVISTTVSNRVKYERTQRAYYRATTTTTPYITTEETTTITTTEPTTTTAPLSYFYRGYVQTSENRQVTGMQVAARRNAENIRRRQESFIHLPQNP